MYGRFGSLADPAIGMGGGGLRPSAEKIGAPRPLTEISNYT